jgi:hypothetical protein
MIENWIRRITLAKATAQERAMRTEQRTTRDHAGVHDSKDSRTQRWAIPIRIIVLLLILGVSIDSIASDIFSTY